jgi:hypothetical protein
MKKILLPAMMLLGLALGGVVVPPDALCQSCNCEPDPLAQVTYMNNVSADPHEAQQTMYLVELKWHFNCKAALQLDDLGYLPNEGSLTYLSFKPDTRFTCGIMGKTERQELCDCNFRPRLSAPTEPKEIDLAPEWVPWLRDGAVKMKSRAVGQFKLQLLQALQKHDFYVHSFKDEGYLIWRTPFKDVRPDDSPVKTQLALKLAIYDEGAGGKADNQESRFLIYHCVREKRCKEQNWDYDGQAQLDSEGLKSADDKLRQVLEEIKQQPQERSSNERPRTDGQRRPRIY